MDEPKKHDRSRVRRNVRTQGTVALAFAYQLRYFGQVVSDDAMNALAAAYVPVEYLFRQHDTRNGQVTLQQVNVTVQQATQTVQGGWGLLAHGLDVFLQALGDCVKHGVENRILAGIVSVNGRGNNADFPSEGNEVQRPRPVGRHQLKGGGSDLLLPNLGLCFSGIL